MAAAGSAEAEKKAVKTGRRRQLVRNANTNGRAFDTMREVTIDGYTFKVRGLDFVEMRQLHKKGIHFGDLAPEKVDPAFIEAAEMIFDADQLDALGKIKPYGRAVKELMPAIMQETYGSRDEEKNLSRSGAGRRTATE